MLPHLFPTSRYGETTNSVSSGSRSTASAAVARRTCRRTIHTVPPIRASARARRAAAGWAPTNSSRAPRPASVRASQSAAGIESQASATSDSASARVVSKRRGRAPPSRRSCRKAFCGRRGGGARRPRSWSPRSPARRRAPTLRRSSGAACGRRRTPAAAGGGLRSGMLSKSDGEHLIEDTQCLEIHALLNTSSGTV